MERPLEWNKSVLVEVVSELKPFVDQRIYVPCCIGVFGVFGLAEVTRRRQLQILGGGNTTRPALASSSSTEAIVAASSGKTRRASRTASCGIC
jgi:hypothetical protein